MADPGAGCGGLGSYECLCGGDLCACENYGEIECFGCADCRSVDDFAGQDEGQEDKAPLAGCACENALIVDTTCDNCIELMKEQEEQSA